MLTLNNRDFLNLRDALLLSGSGNNGVTFIDNEGEHSLTYNSLCQKACRIAGYYQNIFNPEENELIICLDRNLKFVPAFWGGIFSKTKTVPVTVGTNDEHKLKLFNVWDSLVSPYIISTKNIINSLNLFARENGLNDKLEIIKKRFIDYDELEYNLQYTSVEINENDTAFIQFSSGSTGLPKGVVLTHRNLALTINAFLKKTDINPADSFLSWFPLTHDMGLIGWHLSPVIAGINQTLIETNVFVRRPALWMDKASEFKASVLCTPNFGIKHFLTFTKKLNFAEWDLSNVRLVNNGAEPISNELCEEFLRALAPYGLKHSVMTPGYGMAEVGLVAALTNYNSDYETVHVSRKKINIGNKIEEIAVLDENAISFVSEGELIPELNVEIRDKKGRALPESYIGEIYLKGETVTEGYYNNPEATKSAIVNGWLNTGDLGFIKNGELYVTGRSKEIIIINGFNYYPHDIERVCADIEELGLGKVVAASYYDKKQSQESLLIFIYFKGRPEKFVQLSVKIKERIMKAIGLNADKIIPIKNVPKTTSGKIQRFALAQKYINGEYDSIMAEIKSLHDVSDASIIEKNISHDSILIRLYELLSDITPAGNYNPDEELINYGIDSIRSAELLNEIIKKYRIEAGSFFYLPALTLNAAADIISEKIKDGTVGLSNAIDTVNTGGNKYKASQGQFSIYYHYKNNPSSPAYNIAIACRILDEINYDKINAAVKYVINRHEVLRSTYYMEEELYYSIDKSALKDIEFYEAETTDLREIKQIIKKRAEAPFIIENDYPIRTLLYKIKKNEFVFVLNLHHIAGDARTLLLLLKEILACYSELKNYGSVKSILPKAKGSYSEYVAKEKKYINSALFKEASSYWQNQLDNAGFELNIGSYPVENKKGKYASAYFEHGSLSNIIGKNISNYVFSLAAYCLILHRYSGQNEIIVGVPAIDNYVLENENIKREMAGYAINVIPLKSIYIKEEKVECWLNRIKSALLDAMKYKSFPLAMIAGIVSHDKKGGEGLLSSMFTAMPVNYDDRVDMLTIIDAEKEVNYKGLRLKPFNFPQQESLNDLSMEMIETGNLNKYRISYNQGKYDDKIINRLIEHYKKAYDELGAFPDKKVSDIEILSEADLVTLEKVNNTERNYENYKPIYKLIEEQCAKTPQATALIYNGTMYAYKWLNDKANGITRLLIKQGVKSGDFIIVFMQKGIELPAVLYAVMKAGCAFIPLDVDSPAERIRQLLHETGRCRIITTTELETRLSFIKDDVIAIDINSVEEISENPEYSAALDDPIYGIFTSGTTGRPKCAVNLHKGIVNRFKYMDNYFGADEKRILLHTANYIFDTSVYQLFWPLTYGAKVVIPVQSEKLDLEYILDFIHENKVTYIDLVPSVFNTLARLFENNPEAVVKFNSVTHVSIGGEAASPSFIKIFRKYFNNVILTNIYGPTETSIGVTFFNINSDMAMVPIGKPISNCYAYILDAGKNVLPLGITGEIYLGGECVGAGYLNDKIKTDEAFFNDFIKGSGRLYKTGDLGCYLPDGNILFAGRVDEQIKIRGVRIEPDEIKYNILKNGLVNDAVVLAVKENNDDIKIAAFVVVKIPRNIEEVKNAIKENLPDIMYPEIIMQVNKIPVTKNGKADKQALLELLKRESNKKNGGEWQLKGFAKIMLETLGREEVFAEDKFFNCGGSSLKALLLKMKIKQKYKVDIELKEILRNPQLRQIEQLILQMTPVGEDAIPKTERREYYPLSNQQKRMWLLYADNEMAKAYNILCLVKINGEINQQVMKAAWEVLVQRHESLRTKFIVVDGEIVQSICKETNLDYSIVETDNIEKTTYDMIERESGKAFELSTLPLFKLINIVNGKNKSNILIKLSHIITDEWSAKVLFNELGNVYNRLINGKEINLEEMKIQYADYSEWFRRKMDGGYLIPAAEYWKNKITEIEKPTVLPPDFCENNNLTNTAGIVKATIDEILTNKIRYYCSQNDITVFTIMVSAVELILSKYLDADAIVLGMPVNGRSNAMLAGQVGLYINTVLLKNKIDKNASIKNYIKTVKEEISQSLTYQEYPYDEVIRERQENNNTDLLDIFVSYENIESGVGLNIDGKETEYEEIPNRVNKFNLSILFKEGKNNVDILFEYAIQKYDERKIKLFGTHIIDMLNRIVEDKWNTISEIPLLSDSYKKTIIEMSQNYKKQTEEWKSVVDLFEETSMRYSERIAVICNDSSMSYEELDEASDRIAAFLNKNNVSKEKIVALLTEKSIDTITGIIGILKAGAAYLPLDPSTPEERLKLILGDSRCKTVLSNINKKPVWSDYNIINIDEIITHYNIVKKRNAVISRHDLAYVIYTSGSAGKPKGVMIEHHSLSNLIDSLRKEVYDSTGNELNVALQASYVFDASIQQIFPALLRGDTLHLITDEVKLNGKMTADYFSDNRINIADATPTLLDLQIRSGFKMKKENMLSRLLIGGEALDYDLLQRYFKTEYSDDTIITNMYGPTESCVDTVCFTFTKNDIKNSGAVPIGRPMLNTAAYVMNSEQKILPIGIPGELYIEGENVGRGYLNNSQMTDEKFLKNDSNKKCKMYRTGDLCFYGYDGNIRFIGRIDEQIKIRGYRVEPGEIEKVIERVVETKCVVLYDGKNEELVAFIEKTKNKKSDYERMFDSILVKLPAYMRPAKYIELDSIPMNASGKPDRNNLKNIIGKCELIKFDGYKQAPATNTEKMLLHLWKRILEKERIGTEESFYELGGHSLKALTLIADIKKTFNVEVSYKDILSSPTIKQLSSIIESSRMCKYKPIPKADRTEYYDLSNAQKRIWLECEYGLSRAYNIIGGFQLSGYPDIAILKQSIIETVNNYEVLRTKIVNTSSEPKQYFINTSDNVCVYNDLTNYKNPEKALNENIDALIKENKNIYDDRLVAFNIYKTKSSEYFMTASIHHILCDGLSIKIILSEIERRYNDNINGKAKKNDNEKIQYRDYCVWSIKEYNTLKYNKTALYWKKKLKSHSQSLFAKDHSRGEGKRIYYNYNETLSSKIWKYSSDAEVTPFMFMMSIIELSFYKYGGMNKMFIGTPVSGRNHPDLADAVGIFINTVIIKSDISRSDSYSEFLEKVKMELLNTYENQDYPYDLIVAENRSTKDEWMFDIFVSYETRENNIQFGLNGVESKYHEINTRSSKYPVCITVREEKEKLSIIVDYMENIVTEDIVKKIINDMESIIVSIIEDDSIIIGELCETENNGARNKALNITRPKKKKNKQKNKAISTKIEKELAELWENILNIKSVNADDNFIELGGHSIKAMQLVSAIKEKYKINIELKFVFSFQTIEMQANELEGIISKSANDSQDSSEVIVI